MKELLTLRVNAMVPHCAVGWEFTRKGITYLHPTKGHRKVSWARLGFRV
jgi:hypothetical protein